MEVRVEFYAGGRAEETPRAVVIDGRRLAVEEVLERRLVRETPDGPERRGFLLRLADATLVRLQEDDEGRWRIERKNAG